MNLFELKPHPYSQIFPASTDLSELIASVKKLGRLRYGVVVYENQILDGNQRLKACKIANIHPKFNEFKGTDKEALDLVWDLNYQRRHLNESQRAVAFAQYCKFLDHGQHPQSDTVDTLDAAAEKADVGKTTIRRAKKVVQKGTKKQIKSVRQGKKTVAEVVREIDRKEGKAKEEFDLNGSRVPDSAMEYWSRLPEAKMVLAQIQAARGQVKKLKPDDLMWCEVNLNGLTGDLESAINRFSHGVPAYVCPYCKGDHQKKCLGCKGRGVVSKFAYHMAPEELKVKGHVGT
jgi:ParB-like chromosome segregation protein Spo0J